MHDLLSVCSPPCAALDHLELDEEPANEPPMKKAKQLKSANKDPSRLSKQGASVRFGSACTCFCLSRAHSVSAVLFFVLCAPGRS